MSSYSPDLQVRRVARWRRSLVAGALAATLGVVGLIGAQVADAASDSTGTSVVSTTTTTTGSSSSSSSASSDDQSSGSSSGVSSGSSSSSDATSSGS